MYQKSTAVFAITACLLAAANSDQGLMNCSAWCKYQEITDIYKIQQAEVKFATCTFSKMKLVYSRNCRGVAVKRGDTENGETQSGILRDGLSLKRLLYDLGPSTRFSSVEDVPSLKKPEAKAENGLQKDKLRLDNLLYQLFSGNNRRNNERDYLYDY